MASRGKSRDAGRGRISYYVAGTATYSQRHTQLRVRQQRIPPDVFRRLRSAATRAMTRPDLLEPPLAWPIGLSPQLRGCSCRVHQELARGGHELVTESPRPPRRLSVSVAPVSPRRSLGPVRYLQPSGRGLLEGPLTMSAYPDSPIVNGHLPTSQCLPCPHPTLYLPCRTTLRPAEIPTRIRSNRATPATPFSGRLRKQPARGTRARLRPRFRSRPPHDSCIVGLR